MRHYSHEMHSLLRQAFGPEFSWSESVGKVLSIVSDAQDEIEVLRVVQDDLHTMLKATLAEPNGVDLVNRITERVIEARKAG